MGQGIAYNHSMVQNALALGRWLNHLVIDTVSIALVLWLCVAVVFVRGALDSDTPFKVTEVIPTSGYAGREVVFHSNVWRDVKRSCDVEIDRYIWVSVHTESGGIELRQFPGRGGFVPAKEVLRREQMYPGRNVSFQTIPENAAPGPGLVVTHLRYYCNAAHRIWKPIEYNYEAPFTVLASSPSVSSGTTATQ